MIAKINIDGKSRVAIVCSERFNFEALYMARESLLNVLKLVETDFLEQKDLANVADFINEICLGSQEPEVLRTYFGESDFFVAEKPCTIKY